MTALPTNQQPRGWRLCNGTATTCRQHAKHPATAPEQGSGRGGLPYRRDPRGGLRDGPSGSARAVGKRPASDGSFARDIGQQEEPDSIDPRGPPPLSFSFLMTPDFVYHPFLVSDQRILVLRFFFLANQMRFFSSIFLFILTSSAIYPNLF